MWARGQALMLVDAGLLFLVLHLSAILRAKGFLLEWAGWAFWEGRCHHLLALYENKVVLGGPPPSGTLHTIIRLFRNISEYCFPCAR